MEKKNTPLAVASTNAYEALEEWARSRETATLRNDEREDGGSTTSGPKHCRSIRESDPAVFSTEIETARPTPSRSLPPRTGHRGLRAGNARTAWRWRSVVASIDPTTEIDLASGRSDAAGDCLEAPGSSEPGEHMEAPGDGRAWRDVLERCGTPAASRPGASSASGSTSTTPNGHTRLSAEKTPAEAYRGDPQEQQRRQEDRSKEILAR